MDGITADNPVDFQNAGIYRYYRIQPVDYIPLSLLRRLRDIKKDWKPLERDFMSLKKILEQERAEIENLGRLIGGLEDRETSISNLLKQNESTIKIQFENVQKSFKDFFDAADNALRQGARYLRRRIPRLRWLLNDIKVKTEHIKAVEKQMFKEDSNPAMAKRIEFLFVEIEILPNLLEQAIAQQADLNNELKKIDEMRKKIDGITKDSPDLKQQLIRLRGELESITKILVEYHSALDNIVRKKLKPLLNEIEKYENEESEASKTAYY